MYKSAKSENTTAARCRFANIIAERGKLFFDDGHIKGILLPCVDSLLEDFGDKNTVGERLKELPCNTNTVEDREHNRADETSNHRRRFR